MLDLNFRIKIFKWKKIGKYFICNCLIGNFECGNFIVNFKILLYKCGYDKCKIFLFWVGIWL